MESVEKIGPDFWVNLKMFPWAAGLVNIAINAVGEDNVAFLTNPGKFPSAATGKYLWWKQNYPNLGCVITKRKHYLANLSTVLIDDDAKMQMAFKEAGGLVWPWRIQSELIEHSDWSDELAALETWLDWVAVP